MLVMRRHPQLNDKVVQSMIVSTDFNPVVIDDMYDNTSKNDITMLFLALWKCFSQSEKTSIFE